MKQKIEWYKEVLELEPGSRVFFSLAKLLAADGQIFEAVGTLQQGLRKHPDYIEARLLLIELLHQQNAETELIGEIDGLGALFASYPGFWKAWSERLSANPSTLDASLAMNFFASALQGGSVSWSAVINRGIQALLQSEEEQGAAAAAFSDFPPVRTEVVPAEPDKVLAAVREEKVAASVGKSVAPKLTITLNKTHQSVSSAHAAETRGAPGTGKTAKFPPAVAQPLSAQPEILRAPKTEEQGREASAVDEEEGEEAFSLRTRSMAEVLAEQGDLAGALDIYTELIQGAAPEGRASLEARAEELSSRMHSPPAGENREEKTHIPGGESNRLVSLLESLAQRLEARAR